MLENNRGSEAVAAARRAHNEKSTQTFATSNYTLSGGRRLAPGSGCVPRRRARGGGRYTVFWTDCPNCDLDNMLSCDTFDGDQLFQVARLGGLWALYHCYKCGIQGFNTDTRLWRTLELMKTVQNMKEVEQ